MLYLVSSKGFLPLLLRFVTFYSLNFFNLEVLSGG